MQKINKFTQEIKNIFDKRLKSVFIYGSKAHLENVENESDLNLMIIVENLTGEDLKNCSKPVKKWMGEHNFFDKNKNPMPVFMGEKEWFNSSDVYAMEYFDIKENHKIIYGENLVSGLNIKKEDLRLECESEMKNLLMRFRGHYLLNADSPKEITKSLTPLTKTLNAIFKAVLRMKDIDVSKSPYENLSKVHEIVDIDKGFYEKLLCAKEKQCIFTKKEIYQTADEAVVEMEKLLEYINNL